ncbi:hypothetical protein ACFW6F_10315 [Streptomyces sp. NPDC058746]|uniref:hypothetical protein n=1 Tax=Streptomyces sp. NPDC058746 TaxID=3346622 RepID=UPI0036AB3F0A
MADALEHGGAIDGETPYLTPEGELWWAFTGETELNGAPLTPAPHTAARATPPHV